MSYKNIQYINPEGLNKNPAFTNVVVVPPNYTTIYIGGQNAVDASGNIIGKGDLDKQTEQVFINLQIALKSVGAELENIIKWNLYILEGQSIQIGFQAFQKVWGNRPNPPAITFNFVSALANPDFLLELEAVAAIPG